MSIQQLNLFQNELQQTKVPKQENKEIYLNALKTAYDLWDLRAWKKVHNRAEVTEYVANPTHKNSGHSKWCIEQLKALNVPETTIINAILQNKHITYQHRIVPCLLENVECPHFEKTHDFSKCPCKQCNRNQ